MIDSPGKRSFICFLLLLLAFLAHAQAPSEYYKAAEGREGEALKEALYYIIKGHEAYPYTSTAIDTWDIIKETDRDPDNPENVVGIYSAFSMNAAQEYDGGQGWSREHVWAKSRGDFGTTMGAGTDLHHLRAEDISTNSARNNRSFDQSTVPYVDTSTPYLGATDNFTSTEHWTWEPGEGVKGDIARMIFYMATRYEGEGGEPDLELTEEILSPDDKSPLHGKLSALIFWHQEDPVDDQERRRHEIIYHYQGNRNPFIDHPEWALNIWSGEITSIANAALADTPLFLLSPNPVKGKITLSCALEREYFFQVYSSWGQSLLEIKAIPGKAENELQALFKSLGSGVYLLVGRAGEAHQVQRVIKL